MAEEAVDNLDPGTQEDTITSKASEKGWVPKDEWDGDPDDWRPAKEFLDRGELMDRISSQSRQLQQYNSKIDGLEKSLKVLAEHNKKIAEKEYEKAVRDLKAKKAEAIQYGDHETVMNIDDQIDELKETKAELEVQEQQAPTPQGPPPEVTQWMEENSWYNENIVLQGAADAIAKQYLSQKPEAANNPEEVLSHVSRQIRTEFPDKFGSKRRPSATTDPASSGGSKGTQGKAKHKLSDLPPELQKVARNFAASGVMTEQDYINQLVELGELG